MPESLPVQLARVSSAEFVSPEFDCIVAEPEFSEPRYAAVFAELQRGCRSKLLDLRAVRTVQLALFKRLADGWTVGRSAVPRLGIVLDYERWVMFHAVGGSRLRPIAQRGIEVELFYEQQLPDGVAGWFAGRRVEHPLPALLEWLRSEWCPSAGWSRVFDTTDMLVTGFGHRELVPDQLLQLAAIVLSQCGATGAAQADKHVQTALSFLGDTPSRMRCRALRLLASTLQLRGNMEAALAELNTAIGIAVQIRDPIEEASALADVGTYALQDGHFARAEERFRAALSVLSNDDLPYLRATLHHRLALALHWQHKSVDEAEEHAASALALRWDPQSRLASADRELLARIRARRPAQQTEASASGS